MEVKELYLKFDNSIMFAEDLDAIGSNLNLKIGDALFNHERVSNFVVVGIVDGRVYFLRQALFEKLAMA
jgi:hypothetical protein